jgi:PPOX class probable F420-dependent enzyme
MADLNTPKVQKILQSKAFAHLATISSTTGEPQSSPMWFLWDGQHIKLTHTTNRKKYQNIIQDPRVSISITDIDNPYTYAEFRGVVETIEDDPTGAFYNTLAEHYGSSGRYRGDPRVILSVKIQHVVGQNI